MIVEGLQLAEYEVEAIAEALAVGHEEAGLDAPGAPELDRLVRKCTQIRIDGALFDLMLGRRIVLRWDADLGDWRIKVRET